MSTKHVRTTGDLIRFRLKLKIECLACGSTNLLTVPEVSQKLGGGVYLDDLQSRLRCSGCDARTARLSYLG